MDETDAEISAAMIRLQTAIAGIPVETALNAISIQLGVLARLHYA